MVAEREAVMSDAQEPSVSIDADLVRRLIAAQFPDWADLPIRRVEHDGWDNRTFHLGQTMKVRLPSAAHYVEQVEKENTWLPRLAPHLPLPIPTPLAVGRPGEGYPWPWSVSGWIEGETALQAPIADLTLFAREVANFLVALQKINATGGPAPGTHNFHRGAPPSVYDGETRRALEALEGRIDTVLAKRIWEAALDSPWGGASVWFHGDIAVGNLILNGGRLSAVIDFGTCGVGDPACDLAITWTLFEGESRKAFRALLPLDEGTWMRGRAWTLWKALIVYAAEPGTDARLREKARQDLDQLFADPGV